MTLRVAFLGCWGVGLEVLDALHADPRADVVQVVTRSPRPDDPWVGAVFDRAGELNIPVVSFEAMSHAEMGELLSRCGADLLVVHAYPRRLPAEVYGVPRMGTVNVHPSLLPKHRGKSPTEEVLEAGESETGLTTHFMDDGFDTGAVICRERVPVYPGDDREAVIERLKGVVPALVRETLGRLLDPGFTPVPQ